MRLSRVISAVDAHAGGEPGRVIVGGVLDVPGATHVREDASICASTATSCAAMLREPRGYPALCCNLVLPPTIPRPMPAS